ncbi:hypothetical protein AgCh_002035 [Apium graveolens]
MKVNPGAPRPKDGEPLLLAPNDNSWWRGRSFRRRAWILRRCGGVAVVGFLQNNTGRGVWVPRPLRRESKNSLLGKMKIEMNASASRAGISQGWACGTGPVRTGSLVGLRKEFLVEVRNVMSPKPRNGKKKEKGSVDGGIWPSRSPSRIHLPLALGMSNYEAHPRLVHNRIATVHPKYRTRPCPPNEDNPPDRRTVKRTQKELVGKKKRRVEQVLKYAEKKFNLKDMITEANLKRMGALSERVGSLCKYREFVNGKHVPTASEKAKGFDVNELVQIDINRLVDLEQEFFLDASSTIRRVLLTASIILPSSPSILYIGGRGLDKYDFSTKRVFYWCLQKTGRIKYTVTKVDPKAKIPPAVVVPSTPPKIINTTVVDISVKEDAPSKRQKTVPDDQSFVLRYLGASISRLFSEEETKNSEILELQLEKVRLNGHVTAMEKAVDEEKRLVNQAGFTVGFEEWCSSFIANNPEYTFSKFDEETHKWVNDFKDRVADSIKNKRIILGLEEDDASHVPSPLQD